MKLTPNLLSRSLNMNPPLALLLLVVFSAVCAEKCKVCLDISTDNSFLQSIFSPLLTSKCSPTTEEKQCPGKTPDCVTALFTAEEPAFKANFVIKVAQCADRKSWGGVFDMLLAAPGDGLATFTVTGSTGDIDVWSVPHDEM